MYLEVALVYGWLKTFSPRNASSWGSRSLRIEGCATDNQRSELQMCEPKNATKNIYKALPNECHDDVIEYHWFLKCTVLECQALRLCTGLPFFRPLWSFVPSIDLGWSVRIFPVGGSLSYSLWWSLVLVTAEPWWHRRLRRSRAGVRKAFKSGAWKAWSIKRLKKLANPLRLHHGSAVPVKIKQQLNRRSNSPTMLAAWKCRFCWVQVEGHLTHCKGCNRHWRQADHASNPRAASRKTRRSQSVRRPTKREVNSKDAENSEKNKEKEDEMVFTSKLPWVVNSPQTRVALVEDSVTEEKEAAAPTEPQMPSPPTIEEPDVNQVLQHLKALKQALGSLPQEMEIKLQACEEKIKDRALTHGHLNKLGKISKQLKGIAAKLTVMDENWQTFSKKVHQKYEQHRNMYHQSRHELVKSYMEKSQELQMAKEEIQAASHQLTQQYALDQPPTGVVTEEKDAITQAMEQDAQMSLEAMEAMYPSPFQAQDMEVQEMFGEAQDGVDQPKAQPRKDALKPFSRAVTTSPSKVANLHLKPKENEKEKSRAKATSWTWLMKKLERQTIPFKACFSTDHVEFFVE